MSKTVSRSASLKIQGMGYPEESIVFPEPAIGTKQGTLKGKNFSADFFILDSGDWHLIWYEGDDRKTPICSQVISFDLHQVVNK